MATLTKTAITVSCRVRREYTLLTTMLTRLVSVFAVRFEHSPHPNPPRGRGGSRGSSPVHGGGWEG
jgi:hypothetical protein